MKRIVNGGLSREPNSIIDAFKRISDIGQEGLDTFKAHSGKKVRSYLFGQEAIAFVKDGIFSIEHGMVRIIGNDQDNYILLRLAYGKDFVIKVSDGHHVFDFKLPEGDVTIDFDYFS